MVRSRQDHIGNSFPIYYPLQQFGNWRSMAFYNTTFASITSNNSEVYETLRKSQFNEDIWVHEKWFYGIQHGIVLESGALEGLFMSSTYMLEYLSGWTAIHVEANIKSFKKLIRNRYKSINVNAALCSEPAVLHYVDIDLPDTHGIYEFMTKQYVTKWHPSLSPESLNMLPLIQCLTVKQLMRILHLTHIDVWYLDTEGSEISVLKGVDFSAVKFQTVIMECHGYDKPKNKIKMKILQNHNFTCEHEVESCYCKHNSFVPSVKPGKHTYKFNDNWKDDLAKGRLQT